MNRFALASIVEGHGEVEALPVLLRRMYPRLEVPRPVRVKRHRIIRTAGELEHYASIAEANIADRGGRGALVLLLDADEECAAARGPELLGRLNALLPHRPAGCAFAVREYESWLVAGLSEEPNRPDESRPGKQWLAERFGGYSETVHQPKLSASFSIERARAESRSFRHLCTTLDRLVPAES